MSTTTLTLALALTLLPASPEPDAPTPPPATTETPAPTTAEVKETPAPTAADVTEMPPPEKAPGKPAEALVSWTMLGGQAPSGTIITAVAFGLSGLPQASLHYAIADDLSIGVVGSFDFARYIPASGFTASGAIGASIKGSVLLDETLHFGWRGDVGFWMPRGPVDFGIIIDVSLNLLAPITDQLFAGAGVDVPLTIGFAGEASLSWPLLFGGVAEFRVLPPLSIYAEAKLGPAFAAPGGVLFGARVMGGVAYRL